MHEGGTHALACTHTHKHVHRDVSISSSTRGPRLRQFRLLSQCSAHRQMYVMRVCLSVCLSVRPSVGRSVGLSVCLSVSLCMCVCMCCRPWRTATSNGTAKPAKNQMRHVTRRFVWCGLREAKRLCHLVFELSAGGGRKLDLRVRCRDVPCC